MTIILKFRNLSLKVEFQINMKQILNNLKIISKKASLRAWTLETESTGKVK